MKAKRKRVFERVPVAVAKKVALEEAKQARSTARPTRNNGLRSEQNDERTVADPRTGTTNG